MAHNILVVDDDPHIREVICFTLTKAGMETVVARDGAEALEQFQRHAPALIVLDVGMPEMDGLEVCRQIRKTSNVPILFLSARDEEIDRVLGLEIGGDDYVTKPFSPRELVARIRSVLRRTARSAAAEEPDAHYLFEGWRLDPLRRRLTDGAGTLVPLTTAEFRLLVALLDHPRQVLDRDRLLDMVQGREAHLFDRAVDNQVSRLRRKIEVDSRNPVLIQTVRAGGYCLAADVRRVMPERA